MSEKVLCISANTLSDYLNNHFTNFKNINRIDWIDFNNLISMAYEFVDRDQAELDESYKQVIPYTVIRYGFDIFHYMRGKSGGEKRLTSLFSIGVGGHINNEDGETFHECILNGIHRELIEEVGLEICSSKVLNPSAILYDPSNLVGRVHFGVINVIDVSDKNLIKVSDSALANSGWTTIRNAIGKAQSYENWSRLVLEGDIL